MKTVAVQDAVGMVLGHDLTEIIPGQHKIPAFKKGHIIAEDDIPRLLNMGKEHVYVLELGEGMIHENEAAERMAQAALGPGISLSRPAEGKVELSAKQRGLLKINAGALYEINLIEGIMFSTIHTDQVVGHGEKLGGTRIIPLVIEDASVRRVEAICADAGNLIEVKPLRDRAVGIVTTGSEVYRGRIDDAFGPVLRKKFTQLGSHVFRQIIVDDDADMIAGAIRTLISEGAELVAATGGMSVDPDDVTPSGIRAAGGDSIIYGAPVLPGAMFLYGSVSGIPVVGLPGCVMYCATTVFDLVVPRILAGERIARADLARLGHGGFCRSCRECRYPLCGFGKG